MGNRDISRPVSAMMARARSGLMPGISASRATAGSTAASGPAPASGPVVPSPSTPQAAGIAATAPVDPGGELGDPGVEEGDLVQQHLGQLAVVVIEHAVQGLDQVVVLGLHPAAGQGGQRVAGRARPAIIALIMPWPIRWSAWTGHGGQLDQRAFVR